MDTTQKPVLFRHRMGSPTCRLETGAKIRFIGSHYETADRNIISQIRKSRLFNATIFEVAGNPMEQARGVVRTETALRDEIKELKAKIAAADAVAEEEPPKPVRRRRKKKVEEKTDGNG